MQQKLRTLRSRTLSATGLKLFAGITYLHRAGAQRQYNTRLNYDLIKIKEEDPLLYLTYPKNTVCLSVGTSSLGSLLNSPYTFFYRSRMIRELRSKPKKETPHPKPQTLNPPVSWPCVDRLRIRGSSLTKWSSSGREWGYCLGFEGLGFTSWDFPTC